jgi:hypothetical protein
VVTLMIYFALLFGVIAVLSMVAWLQPRRRLAVLRAAAWAGQGATPAAPADDGTSALVARVLRGERRQDMPCVTPIDCVEQNHCDGHCGCH